MKLQMLFLIILIIALNGCSLDLTYEDCIKAERVIDGDTFELRTGETVRLIGIDAPERGKRYYEDSKEHLESLIADKCLYLEKDTSDKDKYNRSLRYVYTNHNQTNEIFINLRMIEDGYASAFTYGNDTKYAVLFNESEVGGGVGW